MTDTRKRDVSGAPDDEAAAAMSNRDEAAPAVETAADQQNAAAREIKDLKDKLLRTLAEMENLRRRTEREVADARLYGISNFARDVLGVADNMRRALDAVNAETRASADAGVNSLIEGIELTERELLKALEKNGIRKIEPLGEKFNPNLHQAMFEIPDPSLPSGSVAQVVQAGYVIGDRVLRPALVGVSKSVPKASASDSN